MRLVKAFCAAVVLSSMLAVPALGATCNRRAAFNAFLTEFKKDATAQGVSRKGLSALDGVTLDESVLAADKRQGVFKQTFEEFSGRMISRDRMTKGLRHLQTHAATLRKVEQQFGVPPAVVVAIWGLETDFGVSVGKKGSDPFGGDARLRLPPHRHVPGAAPRRAPHRRSRRPHAC
jgi:membrane-bound lytic murein transglycosylase B